jgi:hypothetical protein
MSTATKTQHGYLVLADISGYTSFLSTTELEHAHDILSELLELLVARLTPALSLVKLEGDAVFVHAPEATLARGETLLELIEATYVAFRDRVETVHRHTTCTCNACKAIPTLDLKFITHHGDYVVQQVAGRIELAGSDVNLAHRLLKNGVGEATGWRAYALFTERSLEHMCMRPEGMHEQTETYEHLGEVRTYSLDLRARYQELAGARRIVVAPEEAHGSLSCDLPAPPVVAWEWLNDPHKRGLWTAGTTWSAVARPGGRTSVGARNHCAHGKGASLEEILDWRPFEYVTARSEQQGGPPMTMTYTISLEPTAAGTRLTLLLTCQLPLPRPLMRLALKPLLKMVMGHWRHGFAELARLLGEQARRGRRPGRARPRLSTRGVLHRPGSGTARLTTP